MHSIGFKLSKEGLTPTKVKLPDGWDGMLKAFYDLFLKEGNDNIEYAGLPLIYKMEIYNCPELARWVRGLHFELQENAREQIEQINREMKMASVDMPAPPVSEPIRNVNIHL